MGLAFLELHRLRLSRMSKYLSETPVWIDPTREILKNPVKGEAVEKALKFSELRVVKKGNADPIVNISLEPGSNTKTGYVAVRAWSTMQSSKPGSAIQETVVYERYLTEAGLDNLQPVGNVYGKKIYQLDASDSEDP